MPNQTVYGFHTLQERMGERVEDLGEGVIDEAITQAMAEHNRQLDAVRSLFVRRVTEPQTAYRTPGLTRNQPLDEFGRPIPIKTAGRYTVGFPIADSGNAVGWTWQQAIKRTVQDVNDAIRTIQDGDSRYIYDHILAALFAQAAWTFFDNDRAGSLTIMPLANGDAQPYLVAEGMESGATDNHLLAQLNAIAAGADNPLPTIAREIKEHPENGNGDVIVFAPTGLIGSLRGLPTFNPILDPNIAPGANSDRLVGTLGVPLPGELAGYDDAGVWIAEWPRLPAGYLVAVSTGGDRPIGERVDDALALQGFVEMDQNRDFPWYQRNWLRKVGYGAYNRVGAVVYRVGAGSYATPTGFNSPMY